MDVSDLEAWESKHGRIPDGAVVVCYSGWGRKYSKRPEKYFGALSNLLDLAALGVDDGVVRCPL